MKARGAAVSNRFYSWSGTWRRWAVLGLLGLLSAGMFGRAVYLQVINQAFLNHEGDIRQVRVLTLDATRGKITDRNGGLLAMSAPVSTVWAIPDDLLATPQFLAPIAEHLQMTVNDLKKMLVSHQDKQFMYLARKIDPDVANQLMLLHAPGLGADPDYKRFYPASDIAGHVVGFTGLDGRGLSGIEYAFNQALTGTAGHHRVLRDAGGRVVEESEGQEPIPGHDVNLTLDLRLQYLAMRELMRGVSENHARGGLMIIIDPNTGDILASASVPTFNPNHVESSTSVGLRDRVLMDAFEPGSSIKPLLLSYGLDAGLIKPTMTIDTTPGYFQVGKLTVHDLHPEGVITLQKLLQKSSNVGAAKVGLGLGALNVYAGYDLFGLNSSTKPGLPGETSGRLRDPAHWGEIATATASYGYGITVNSLQMIRAYAAIANDGLLPELSIVKRTPEQMPAPKRVIAASTARLMRQWLETVVQPGGTATKAAVTGYRVAGKTGTVRQNAHGKYVVKSYNSVFVGMIPAQHPEFLALVMIDDPQNGDYYGGLVSAPVFSRVMTEAVRFWGIPPTEPIPLQIVLRNQKLAATGDSVDAPDTTVITAVKEDKEIPGATADPALAAPPADEAWPTAGENETHEESLPPFADSAATLSPTGSRKQ